MPANRVPTTAGWSIYAGTSYKHEGSGRFLFQSRTGNGTYVTDIHEKHCSCPGYRKVGLCHHFKLLSALLKSLKNHQPPPNTP
jgi:hypothetical protein